METNDINFDDYKNYIEKQLNSMIDKLRSYYELTRNWVALNENQYNYNSSAGVILRQMNADSFMYLRCRHKSDSTYTLEDSISDKEHLITDEEFDLCFKEDISWYNEELGWDMPYAPYIQKKIKDDDCKYRYIDYRKNKDDRFSYEYAINVARVNEEMTLPINDEFYDMYVFIKKGLIPDIFRSNEEYLKTLNTLRQLFQEVYSADVFTKDENENLSIDWDMLDEDDVARMIECLDESSLTKTFVQKMIRGGISLEIEKLLYCDFQRARLDVYDLTRLTDITLGHWDLFEIKDEEFNDMQKNSNQRLIRRDPRKDIKNNAVVGIDFGTKSTVVMIQSGTNKIIPVRIGTKSLKDIVTPKDFENPTIIEFLNIENFLRDYTRKDGRPETKADDVITSYDAYNQYRDCSNNMFYSYFTKLKQWCNSDEQYYEILDHNNYIQELKNYFNIGGNDFDPIEIYAYYIGLRLNNMSNGIYLKYLLSYPVSYPATIREKIRESFEKGLKKSLPQTVLADDEIMKKFEVKLGISEPAAYAVTALEEYGFEPEDENDTINYAIFDFGGGTTDFDFGIGRGATEKELDTSEIDTVIECFGAGCDPTLGGENLLELLAYEVLKSNMDYVRENNIVFSYPNEKMAPVIGGESIIIVSKEANRNMTAVAEELRPYLHCETNWKDKYLRNSNEMFDNIIDDDNSNYDEGESEQEYILTPVLYDRNGQPLSGCELTVDFEALDEILENRIQKGIDEFFENMFSAFDKVGKSGEDKYHIFLAGNSSKSERVRKLFEVKINKLNEDEESKYVNSTFDLHDPFENDFSDLEKFRPNGKIGVAYGLLKSRDGNHVRVNKNKQNEPTSETHFKYYVGKIQRRKFVPKLNPFDEYGKWKFFMGAGVSTIRFYYTDSSLASQNDERVDLDEIPFIEQQNEEKFPGDVNIYIRSLSPKKIEYIFATEDEIENGDIDESKVIAVTFK